MIFNNIKRSDIVVDHVTNITDSRDHSKVISV